MSKVTKFKYIFTEVDGILETKYIPQCWFTHDGNDKECLISNLDGRFVERPITHMGDEPQELCDGFYIDIPGRAFNPLWIYKDFASCQKAATLLEENYIKGFVKTEEGLTFVWNFSKNEVIRQCMPMLRRVLNNE